MLKWNQETFAVNVRIEFYCDLVALAEECRLDPIALVPFGDSLPYARELQVLHSDRQSPYFRVVQRLPLPDMPSPSFMEPYRFHFYEMFSILGYHVEVCPVLAYLDSCSS